MNIQALLESGANVAVTVTPLDLKEFALFLISQVKSNESENSRTDIYLTPDEVATMIGVSKNTLWRWEKDGYLTPFKIGRKIRYKQSDVTTLIIGKVETK